MSNIRNITTAVSKFTRAKLSSPLSSDQPFPDSVAKIAQPFMAGKHRPKRNHSRRDERPSELTKRSIVPAGLTRCFANREPSAKALGYFHSSAPQNTQAPSGRHLPSLCADDAAPDGAMDSLSSRIYKDVAPTALGALIPLPQPGGLAEISRGQAHAPPPDFVSHRIASGKHHPFRRPSGTNIF